MMLRVIMKSVELRDDFYIISNLEHPHRPFSVCSFFQFIGYIFYIVALFLRFYQQQHAGHKSGLQFKHVKDPPPYTDFSGLTPC